MAFILLSAMVETRSFVIFQVNRGGISVDIRMVSASPKAGEIPPNGGYFVVVG
jgi:hypothetical protein